MRFFRNNFAKVFKCLSGIKNNTNLTYAQLYVLFNLRALLVEIKKKDL